MVNGASFALTILALIKMRVSELRPMQTAARGKGQIRESIRYVRHRTDILVILVVVGVVSAFGMNFAITSAMMARVEFGKGPGEYGLVGSVMAIGSLTGALLAARRERPRVRLVIGAAIGFALAAGLTAVMPTYTAYVLASIPLGLATLTMITAANSTIQLSTEPEMRGRVMSLYMLVFLGATPIGSPFIGWLCGVAGPRWGIGVGAITAGLAAIGAAVWAIRSWHLKVGYAVRPRPHLVVRYLDQEPVAPDG
jgi:MFS family permease